MSDDADLERIRQARMQELAAQRGGGAGGIGGGPGMDDQEAQRAAQDEARSSILTQILTPDAQDRLGRIKLVNEARARALEDSLIGMARTGRIRSRVTDEELVRLLNSPGARGEREEQKVVFRRRKEESDDELDGF